MVKGSYDHDVPDQIRLLREIGEIVEAVYSFEHAFLVDLEVCLSRRLDYWLSQWLCVLFHDQVLNICAENLLWVWVVLLVFMKNDLLTCGVVF